MYWLDGRSYRGRRRSCYDRYVVKCPFKLLGGAWLVKSKGNLVHIRLESLI